MLEWYFDDGREDVADAQLDRLIEAHDGAFSQDAVAADQAYPVMRFYNERTGTHFYTIDTDERDQVLRLYPWFDYEGVQFYAYKTPVAGSLPVYRFFNTSTGTHFYTIVPEEKDYVLQRYPVSPSKARRTTR